MKRKHVFALCLMAMIELAHTGALHLLVKDGIKLGTELIHKEGVDDLVDILDAGVVHASRADLVVRAGVVLWGYSLCINS